ncbi:hypothetical protein D3C72_1564210 [compost metagenome]
MAERVVHLLEVVDIGDQQASEVLLVVVVVDGGETVVEGAAVGETRQRIRVGDPLVFIEFLADDLHLEGLLHNGLDAFLALAHRVGGGFGQDADGVAQDVGAGGALAGYVDIGLIENLVVVLERILLVLQQVDQFGELGGKACMRALYAGRTVDMAEILRADRIEFFLGRAASQRRQFLGQLRVRTEIGFVIKLVIARYRRHAHHAHRMGDLRCDIRSLHFSRGGRLHPQTPNITHCLQVLIFRGK